MGDTVVEELPRCATTEDQGSTHNPNPRPHGDDEEDLEEGEIVVDDPSASLKQSAAITHQPHPLEHSWTFWFDNPSAKSKQAAWGSSMRPIYTFSNVEEFWRYPISWSFFCFFFSLFVFREISGKKKKIKWISVKLRYYGTVGIVVCWDWFRVWLVSTMFVGQFCILTVSSSVENWSIL